MLKLTRLTDEPLCCQNSPLGVMILSYAALCRMDEGYCRFYEQDDAAVVLQNGSALVVCAKENADFDEIRQLADFLGCRTILCENADLSDDQTVLTRSGLTMRGFFDKAEEPVGTPQNMAEYRAVYDLLELRGIDFSDWFADVNLRIRRQTAAIAVAAENGEIVATASVLHRMPNSRVIGAVATKAGQRGRGFASALVRKLCAQTSYVLCLPELEGFYRRLGFSTCGQWFEYERIKETE